MHKLLTPSQMTKFFEILSSKNPIPKTELYYTNPYTLLVAVVLSAQATDKGVNKATPHLFEKADTPEKMISLGLEGIRDAIKTIGLFNTKTKNIFSLSQKLIKLHHSQVPNDRAALEALPGVGRKTANVVLNTAFNQATIAVDTHIFRITNRIGLGAGKTPLEVEKSLMDRIPPKFLKDAHHWLVLHGRYICKARMPNCPDCPVQHLCLWPNKTPLRGA